MYLFLEFFDYLSLFCVLFLRLLQCLITNFEVFLKLFDELLLSFPVLLHVGHLLLHLGLIALKLHISYLRAVKLFSKPLSVIHQNLRDAEDLLEVLL